MLLDNRKRRRRAHAAAVRRLQAAPHADLHLRQQVRPRRRRSAQAHQRRRSRPRDRLPPGHVADPPRRRVRRRVRPPAQAGRAVRARRGSRRRAWRSRRAPTSTIPRCATLLGEEAHEQLVQDIALLDEAGHPFDEAAVLAGRAVAGVLRQRAHELRRRAVPARVPRARAGAGAARVDDGHRRADDPEFTGFVFKIQANMDPQASRPRRVRAHLLGALRGRACR